MLRVGLTGGIGCGKSAVAERFAALGVPVLDADLLSRELVEPGRPALAAIVARFGPEILADGKLDRAALRRRVFADATSRRWLEALLHPLVYEEMAARAAALEAPYVLLVIPLLLESGRRDFVDWLLVVDCPEPLQRERVRARDGLDEEQIDRILAAQVSRQQRLDAADAVICNDGDWHSLSAAVEVEHRRLLRLAAARVGARAAGPDCRKGQ